MILFGTSTLLDTLLKFIMPIRYVFGILSFFYLLLLLSYLLLFFKSDKRKVVLSNMVNMVIAGFSLVGVVLTTYLFSWTLGVPITVVLGFDPARNIAEGIQWVNAAMSSTTFTNIILLLILNYLISNDN